MPRPRSAAASSGPDAASPETAVVTFEDAMGELEDIVQALESEPLPLDDLVGKYERGMSLLRQCRRQIDSAQLRIEQITRRGDDAVAAVPFASGASATAPASVFPSAAEPVSPASSANVPPSASARSKPAAAAASFSADDEIRLF